MRALPEPAALLFDLDGTLVDTVEIRIAAWLRTFEELGWNARRDHVAGLIGIDGRRLAREVGEADRHPVDDDAAERIDARAGAIYDDLNRSPAALPDVRSLLGALAESDLPWAIATSSRADQVTRSVEALGLRSAPRIVDGGSVAHAKPAPDLLVQAAERLARRPELCWYVGDATWDVLAGRACGMTVIGVATGAVPRETLIEAGAAAVIDTLGPLEKELRRRRRL